MLSNFFVYRFSVDSQLQQLRQQLMVVAQTASLLVDGDALLRVPLTREGMQSPEYAAVAGQLKKIGAKGPDLTFGARLGTLGLVVKRVTVFLKLTH